MGIQPPSTSTLKPYLEAAMFCLDDVLDDVINAMERLAAIGLTANIDLAEHQLHLRQ